MQNDFEWTKDQTKALQIIQDWWNTFGRNQCLMLSGAAGTGKTTLIAKLPKILKNKYGCINISYATLTAKASLVLRNKGVPASTIHSLIYNTKIKEDPITHRVKYEFTKKDALGCDLIVIDESSMVSDQLYNDLKSFGKPIIFIGDKFQLPPINSEFNLMDDKFLSYSMTDIVRQQADNLIITMSTKLRNREQTPFIRYPQFSKISKKFFDKSSMINFDQIITGKNKTRIELNKFYRKDILHYNSEIPIMGDKVIFLKNNYEDYVFNGQQVILDKNLEQLGRGTFTLTGTDIVTNEGVCVDVVTDFINTLPVDVEQKRYNKVVKNKSNNLIDYAYVISCHKCVSQNTNIFTNNGIIKIKDYNGEKIFNGIEFVNPKQFINNGKTIVKTITTHNGFTNTTTLNHQHVVINENCQLIKKTTEELKIGDIFLIHKNINNIEKQYLTKETNYIPKIINEQFAQLLGLFFSHSWCVYNKKMCFRLLTYSNVAKRFKYLINKMFNSSFYIKEHRKNKKTSDIYCFFENQILKQLFQIYPDLKSRIKCVPQQIFLSKNSVQKAFLRGVFYSGHLNKNGQIVFHSHIYQFSKDIQILLLNNKIISSLRQSVKKTRLKQYYVNILYNYLNDFKKEICFVSKYKNKTLKNKTKTLYKVSCSCIETIKKYLNNNKCVDAEQYKKIKHIIDNYELDVVQNISEPTIQNTYCFQIEDTHMFIQNGILSGNSQGSQFDNVLVMDDYFFYGNDEMRFRWLYTAITRASKSVTWVV